MKLSSSLFLFAAIACQGMSAVIESYKGESNSFFIQSTIGLGVTATLSTTIDLPGVKWATPTSIAQFNRLPPAPADLLRLNGTVQHLVPIDPGDPVPGPRFEWFHTFESRVGLNGDQIQIYSTGAQHGLGVDAVVSVSVAKVGPIDIDFYSNFLFGAHLREGDTLDSLLGKIKEEGPELLKGASGVMIDRRGRQTLIGATLHGVQPNQVHSTQIRFGPPSSGGPIVIDLGGGGSWNSAPDIGMAMQVNAIAPDQFLTALVAGECYLEVLTNEFPQRRFVATLGRINDSESYNAHSAMVEMGLEFGGSVSSLHESDNDSIIILLDEIDSTGRLVVQGFVVFTPLPQLQFEIESRSSRRDLLELLQVKRVFVDQWDYVSGRLPSQFDSKYRASVVAIDGQYSTPASGNTFARLTWIPAIDVSDADGWIVSVDQFKFLSGPVP